MSRHVPGSKDWWVETGLIALGGVLLAAWLWSLPDDIGEAPTSLPNLAHEPRTMADMLEAGCLTADHLRQMREGNAVTITSCNGDAIAPWPMGSQ